MTDFPDWQAPQAQATAIAGTGVPLLTGSTLLYKQATPGLGPGATAGSGHLPVTQIGYEILVSAQFAAGTANPFCRVDLIWVDTTSGATVARDTYYVPGATAAGGWLVVGRGPTKASQVDINVTNLDAANPVTVAVTALQNSRVYPTDTWRWRNDIDGNLVVPGFTLPSLPPDTAVLGLVSGANVAAGGTSVWLAGMAPGDPVYFTFSASAATYRIHAYPDPVSVYGNTPELIPVAASGTTATFPFIGPAGPIAILVNNTGSTAITVSWSLLAQT